MVAKRIYARWLPTALIVVALIALPATANVYAQGGEDKPKDSTTKKTNDKETANVTNEEPAETESLLPDDQAGATIVPAMAPAPSASPSPALTAVTLAQAQTIAETEHPQSVVITAKTKEFKGETAYTFTFDDGWKVLVRASDGTVVNVHDKAGKEHACKNNHKSSVTGRAKEAVPAGTEHAKWKESTRHDARGHRGHAE